MRPKYFCFGRLFIYLPLKYTPIKANRTMDKLRGFGISAFVALAAFGCFGCGHRSATVGTVNGESVEAPAGDSVVTVRGRLTIAHEVRSFTAEGDSVEYWVVDKSGDLIPRYTEVTGDKAKVGGTVYAELEVEPRGYSDEGFAAEYAGVYWVRRVVSMRKY